MNLEYFIIFDQEEVSSFFLDISIISSSLGFHQSFKLSYNKCNVMDYTAFKIFGIDIYLTCCKDLYISH